MNEGRLTNISSSGEKIYTREIPPIIRRGNVAVSSTIKEGDLLTRDSYGKIKRFARSQSGSPLADVDISASDAVNIVGVALEDITTTSEQSSVFVDFLVFGAVTPGKVQVGGSETALKAGEKDVLARVGLFVN